MAWALNEALTELSLIPEALSLLRQSSDSQEGRRRLRDFWDQSGVSLDLLYNEDIPEAHGGDAYAWLAADLIVFARRLGFLAPSAPGARFRLTELGNAVASERVSPESGVAASLFHWRLDAGREKGEPGVRPVPRLLEILDALGAEADQACPGLLLPEFMLTMALIEGGASANACLEAVRDWRARAVGDKEFPDAEAARREICDHLADRARSEDLCGARTTLSNILASGTAAYGAFFGVQYATAHRAFLDAVAGAAGGGESGARAIGALADMPPFDLAARFDAAAEDS